MCRFNLLDGCAVWWLEEVRLVSMCCGRALKSFDRIFLIWSVGLCLVIFELLSNSFSFIWLLSVGRGRFL